MHPEIKQSWVKAIRSGDFYQAHERLRTDDNAHDPLGILCELYRTKTGRGSWQRDHKGGGYRFHDGEVADVIPPERVRRWAGMKLSDVSSCLDLNDYEQRSFQTIANFIETKL